MRTVNIADLKARLSSHIRFVRKGEEVLVCERNRPVARIIPCDLEGISEHEKSLIASGELVPPRKKRHSSRVWPTPPGDISAEAMALVWREERGES